MQKKLFMERNWPVMGFPPPIGLGLRYLGFQVIEAWDGKPERIRLQFGDEDQDRIMVVRQCIDVIADYDGYRDESPYLRFEIVPLPTRIIS